MLAISAGQLSAFEQRSLEQFAQSAVTALGEVAGQQGHRDPQAAALAWLESAVRIAMRRGVGDGQEIAALALLVADLGADFDLDRRHVDLTDLIDQDPLGGASAAAAVVAGRLASSTA